MVTRISAWKDSKGAIHATKESALAAEIELALGKVGDTENAVTPGLAKLIIANRLPLIALLQEFDVGPTDDAHAGEGACQ